MGDFGPRLSLTCARSARRGDSSHRVRVSGRRTPRCTICRPIRRRTLRSLGRSQRRARAISRWAPTAGCAERAHRVARLPAANRRRSIQPIGSRCCGGCMRRCRVSASLRSHRPAPLAIAASRRRLPRSVRARLKAGQRLGDAQAASAFACRPPCFNDIARNSNKLNRRSVVEKPTMSPKSRPVLRRPPSSSS